MHEDSVVYEMYIRLNEQGRPVFSYGTPSTKPLVSRNYNYVSSAISGYDSTVKHYGLKEAHDGVIKNCISKLDSPGRLTRFILGAIKHAIYERDDRIVLLLGLVNDKIKTDLKDSGINIRNYRATPAFNLIVFDIFKNRVKMATAVMTVTDKFYSLAIMIMDFITNRSTSEVKLRTMKEILIEQLNRK